MKNNPDIQVNKKKKQDVIIPLLSVKLIDQLTEMNAEIIQFPDFVVLPTKRRDSSPPQRDIN